MSGKIVYGGQLVCDADSVIPSGALYIEGDTILEVGSYQDIMGRHPGAELIGDAQFIVTPGFINAHGHGKGLTDFQRGALDDTLETWKLRRFPPLGPLGLHYDTLWAAVRLIESGVTATMHNHNLICSREYEREFSTLIEAYRSTGIRLALAPTLIDSNVFVYGDNEAFIRGLPPDLQQLCRRILEAVAHFGPQQYFQAVRELHRRWHSERVRILHGPLAPQWVSDELLQEVKRQAREAGQRVHIHVLQTSLQKLYGYRSYGKSLLEHLEEIGFLGPEVTCGHCVWVTEHDIEILAATAASVTHHPACNLRVRSGLAPVAAMLEKGVAVGIGMDEKELGDDKDYLEEMRLAARLHRLGCQRLDSPALLPEDVFRMGTELGAEVLGFGALCGTLRPGRKADVVLLNTQRMSEPYTYPDHSPIDLLIYRGRSADVDTMLVGGEPLLRGGRLTRLDRGEILARLRESLPPDYAAQYQSLNEPVGRLRAHIARWFEPWFDEIEDSRQEPYYPLNSRI